MSSSERTRPTGELVWCHATETEHAEIALRIADRLTNQRPDVHLLLTTAPGVAPPEERGSVSTLLMPLPAENSAAVREFLDQWQPDVCLWTAGQLRPTLLATAHKRGIPLYLVDADTALLSPRGWSWLPNSRGNTLRLFSAIMARNSETADALHRNLGQRGTPITVTGHLHQESRPLPCNESDREELAMLLRARPVWHAAHVQRDEVTTILSANHDIIRVSHRTVLIISPEDEGWLDSFHNALRNSGLRYITWSEGELPDENTQVILADTPEELGLWYRISPITFMGSSLIADANGRDPNEPAAHGSAILYGPNVRQYLETYARFAEHGAARIVRDARTLAAAVQRVIPADQSAAMAHAAWDLSTQSAAVMDQLVQIITDELDKRGAT